MLNDKIETALNDQFNQEQAAAQEYLAMAAWCDDKNFKGFAAFMRRQSEEERMHALKFFDHICDRGGCPRVDAIPAPNMKFKTALDIFKAALERERSNTRNINSVYKLANEQDDYATQAFLHWFITEQVEEEAWADEAVGLLETAGDNTSALLMLDQRYATYETE